MIRDAIVEEHSAVKTYEGIRESALSAHTEYGAEFYADVARLMRHLADEERVHVGELQEVLNRFRGEEHLFDEGREEAAEELLREAVREACSQRTRGVRRSR
jgi:rubrerythrin